jgi:hypothetical protein
MAALGTATETASYYDLNFASVGVSTETGTAYTFRPTDSGGWVRFTNDNAVTATIAPFSSIEFPFGAVIMAEQAGAGAVTVVGGPGVTVYGTVSASAQYSVLRLTNVAKNLWSVTGEAGTVAFIPRIAVYETFADVEAAEVSASSVEVQTLGYFAGGDGGGAFYIRTSGSTPGGFQSADGDWWELAEQLLNVRMFGAAGDATVSTGTDDTQAFIDCATRASTDPGGTIYIPAGQYLVSATPLTFTGAYCPNIIGEGMEASRILVKNGTADTVDVIHVSITTQNYYGIRFADFGITSQRGIGHADGGRYGIYFDYPVNTNTLPNFMIERVYIREIGNSTTGASIYSSSKIGGNGFAYSVVRNCYLEACVFLNAMDNIRIEHNVIACYRAMAYPGIQFGNTPGAANFTIVGNDIASVNGNVLATKGTSAIIRDNEFETPTTIACTAVNNAMVDLDGSSGAITHCVVDGNGFSSLPGSGSPNPLRISSIQSAQVVNNRFYADSTQKCIKITSFALDSVIGPNLYYESGVLTYSSIDNSGTRSQIWKQDEAYTPTITTTSGTITTLGTVTGRWSRVDQYVSVDIRAVITTNGSGAGGVKATLPTGIAALNTGFINGSENVTRKAVYGIISPSGTFATIFFYDGTYPGADGADIRLSGTFEVG